MCVGCVSRPCIHQLTFLHDRTSTSAQSRGDVWWNLPRCARSSDLLFNFATQCDKTLNHWHCRWHVASEISFRGVTRWVWMAVNKMTLLFVFVVLLPGCQDEQVAGVWPANHFTNVIYCRLPFYAPIDTVSVPRVAATHTDSVFPFAAQPESFNHPKKNTPCPPNGK